MSPPGTKEAMEGNPALHRALWAVLILVMAGLCVALAFRSFRDSERRGGIPLPKLAQVGAFRMIGSDGQPVTEQAVAGKIWVAQFFFTECPGPCPAVSRQLAVLQNMIEKTTDVLLVSISIDPEHDTPAALRAYAQLMGADPKRWLFLTGTPETVQQLVTKNFMIGFKENPQDIQATEGRFIHSTKVALVDGTGTVRGYYDGLDIETPQRVLADITSLMQEEGLK